MRVYAATSNSLHDATGAILNLGLTQRGQKVKINIMGTRLQDEAGAYFVVFNLPWKLLATPDMAEATMMAFKKFDFPYVFAIRSAGRWIYVGKESLKAICHLYWGKDQTGRRFPLRRIHRSERQLRSL